MPKDYEKPEYQSNVDKYESNADKYQSNEDKYREAEKNDTPRDRPTDSDATHLNHPK